MGFHRGSDIVSGHRMLLQLEFSVIDTPQVNELARTIEPCVVPGLHPGIARITHKFYRPGPVLGG